MLTLTDDQHIEILKRLIVKAKELVHPPKIHKAGIEYTSLMNCFLLHNLSCADSLMRLLNSFTIEWFPVTIGYTIVRPMFEIDINSHYISQNPKENSIKYIKFEKINLYNQMMSIKKHRDSKEDSWKEAMTLMWDSYWQEKETDITDDYHSVISMFSKKDNKNKVIPFHNWSGKSLKQIAKEVDHEEAYDIFYSELSSFTHVDINFANRFLRIEQDGITWTSRANYYDRANIFRFAATFMTCFMELFGKEFNLWTEDELHECWNLK